MNWNYLWNKFELNLKTNIIKYYLIIFEGIWLSIWKANNFKQFFQNLLFENKKQIQISSQHSNIFVFVFASKFKYFQIFWRQIPNMSELTLKPQMAKNVACLISDQKWLKNNHHDTYTTIENDSLLNLLLFKIVFRTFCGPCRWWIQQRISGSALTRWALPTSTGRPTTWIVWTIFSYPSFGFHWWKDTCLCWRYWYWRWNGKRK